MKAFRNILIFSIMLMILSMSVTVIARAQEGTEYIPLREYSEKTGMKIGFATMNNFWSIADAEEYMEIAKTEFNILTPENQMKWDTLHPQKDSYNFEPAEKHVQFAEENNMVVHGHTLVWHSQNPFWLTSNRWKDKELKEVLEDHINTVVGHFKGRVKIWDVVNEAFNGDGSYRKSIWYNALGKGYIEESFTLAHNVDPDAVLIYNDYSIGNINKKSDAIYEMIADFKKRGVPIDGIGFQMHLTENGIDKRNFAQNLQRFADLGLDLYITELDVRIPENPSMQELLTQAEIYRQVMEVCLEQPAVKAVQIWGFTDKHSWIPNTFPGRDSALVFDKNYKAKPSFYALKEVLSSFTLTMKEYKRMELEKENEQLYNIKVEVQNTGVEEEQKEIKLFVNEKVAAVKNIILKPREKKKINFQYKFKKSGTYSVRAGDLSPVKVKIPGSFTILQPAVWMDFEGNLENLSSSGVRGESSGEVKFVNGKHRKGVRLQGNSSVKLVDPLFKKTDGSQLLTIPEEGSFSIGLWFKPEPNEDEWGPYALFDATKNPIYFFVSVSSNNLMWQYEDSQDSDFQMGVEYEFERGRWYHLTLTGGFAQNVPMKIFINGQEMASKDILPGKRGELLQPVIGADSDTTYYPDHTGFKGVIDGLRVFPWILSREEVIEFLMGNNGFSQVKGTHITEWKELGEDLTIETIKTRAILQENDKVETIIEVSNDKKDIIDSTLLILKDGEHNYSVDLESAKYFRIKSVLAGYKPIVDEYELKLNNSKTYTWDVTSEWAEGSWSNNIYIESLQEINKEKLMEKEANSEKANTVDITEENSSKDTENKKDTDQTVLEELNLDFEDQQTAGWNARGGDVKVTITDNAAHSGKFSIYVKDRTNNWHGIQKDIKDIVEPGNTYDFSIWVYQESGKTQNMNLTMQRVFDSEERGWDRIVGEVPVETGKWVELKGNYTIPKNKPVEELIIYVESANKTLEFYIDSFNMKKSLK